ncbi:MAG: hypothetical protein QOI32_2709 [Thermoleophilaceae bacterium]|jgi:hypothetical protein|nr:hypothetical protein [Thermoleophilaceae bacterium]
MPARMPHRLLMLLCLLALAAGAAACGEADVEQGVEEAAREGLALELEGVDYNVFITRQLNTRIPPDSAYVDAGTEPAKGETLYGVFIQVCNTSKESHRTVDSFKIVDNQGNEFEPEELPEDNQFAYHPRELLPAECIPEAGSVAQLGPTSGAMLLFRLPLENTEYRPLELEVEGSDGEHLTFLLDI